MKRYIKTLCLGLMLLFSASAMAQNKVVTGTVIDELGEPVIGATVRVEGTSIATVTDMDGNYKLEAPQNGKIVISYIGYLSFSVVSDSLRPHGLQHTRLPCPSPSPGACSNSSIEWMVPSNHLILCRPLLLLPSVFPSVRRRVSSLHQVAKVLELQLQHQSFQ